MPLHRKLKDHEARLLKKHDFLQYKWEKKSNESKVIRKYYLQNREDYKHYQRLAGEVTALVHRVRYLKPSSKVRIQVTEQLLEKLYNLGVVHDKSTLEGVEKISVAKFCERRLNVMVVKLRMAQTMPLAIKYIEQGHIRVGPNTVTDPAFLVPRELEDHVTWAQGSKIREKVLSYNRAKDDYDFEND
eukprot:Hpha_TRINITY_DN6990_c0_g1::TRINITY_DN6990_c0_g1_i1::g.139487::m.139487/K14560/IMP3; U3 small nucleolar ribonucleoprotein protein IMP3